VEARYKWTCADVAGKNQLLGDMLCLGAAVLFAVVSVAQELVVKTLDWVEYLGIVGLLGSILSILQTYVPVD
jgi:solute carrier family 35 protein F1/2